MAYMRWALLSTVFLLQSKSMNDISHLLLSLPLWSIFIFTFILLLLAFKSGEILGKRHRLTAEKEDRSPIGSIVGATLGLLAFLLAFSFGLAASRFDERRTLVIDEANAIGTTYLRAGYLSEPYRRRIRDLLKEYVFVRIEALKPGKLEQGIKKSEELQDQLWQQAVNVAENNFDSDLVALFVKSLNEVIDLHTKRINVGIRFRIPFIVWAMLYVVTFLSIGSLGYQFGLVHTRYIGITVLLILTFSSVILLIWDLDRPQEGFVQVSQQSLVDLMNKFNETK